MPTAKANVAKSKIAHIFEPLTSFEKLRVMIPAFQHRYLFMPPEHAMQDNASTVEYKKLISRHHTHTSMLNATLMDNIYKDLNTSNEMKQNLRITLREIILSIMSKKKQSAYKRTEIISCGRLYIR